MPAVMVVYMNILDPSWMEPYFSEVPKLLSEYGAVSLAGGREVVRLEGRMAPPDRLAIFLFPSLAAIDRFMADERYRPYRTMREKGSSSEIFVFENAVTVGELV